MSPKNISAFYLAFVLLVLAGIACSDLSRMPVVTRAPDARHTAGVEAVIRGMTETQSAKASLEINTTPSPQITVRAIPTQLPTQTPNPQPTELPITLPTLTLSPLPSSTSTQEMVFVPTLSGSAYFADDFSTQGGWAVKDEPNRYSYGYDDGRYRISILVKNLEIWSIRDQKVKDVIIETEMLDPSGGEAGYFGVVCRWEDVDNYYRLTIGLDGTAAIAKKKNGGVQELLSIKPSQADELLKPPIKLRAVCQGNTLALYIQGTKLLEVADDDHDAGSFGVLAGSKAAPGITIYFDNYVVYMP